MSQHAGQERLSSVEQVDTIVDADSHVTEDLDQIIPYMEDKVVRDSIDNAALLPHSDVYSTTNPTPPWPDIVSSDRGTDNFGVPSCRTPEEKLNEMSELGLDYVIIDPTLTSAVNSVNNPRYANALVQAFNSWYLDTFADYDERLKGTILVSGHKPARMAEEIDEHADEDGIVGVQLPASALVPPAGDEKYDPIYQAAEDKGLPIVMHSVSNTTGVAFPIQSTWNQTYVEDHMIHHPFTHIWNLTTMMFRGLPERFPDLEYVLQESGIAWLPYATWRMDDHYLELSHEIPWLDKLPSEYVDEKFHFSTQPLGHTAKNPQHLAQIIEIIGPGNILYASDVPHPDFDPPEELFDRIAGHFDAETTQAIMGGTAADVFGLSNG